MPETPSKTEIISRLLIKLDGVIPGFPDTKQKFDNAVEAIAEFAAVEPQPNFEYGAWTASVANACPHTLAIESRSSKCNECGAQKLVPNPAAWLISQLKTRCRWWPSIAEIREFYCHNFRPADGIEPGEEIGGRARRAIQED